MLLSSNLFSILHLLSSLFLIVYSYSILFQSHSFYCLFQYSVIVYHLVELGILSHFLLLFFYWFFRLLYLHHIVLYKVSFLYLCSLRDLMTCINIWFILDSLCQCHFYCVADHYLLLHIIFSFIYWIWYRVLLVHLAYLVSIYFFCSYIDFTVYYVTLSLKFDFC